MSAGIRSVFGRLIRSPIVQIAAVVAIVYLAIPERAFQKFEPVQLPIQVAAANFESAVLAWEKVHGTPPTEADEELILDRLAADEVLFRRALELGLDETPITDVRLKQLAEFVGGVDEHGAQQDFIEELKGQEFAQRDPIMRSHLIQTMKLVARKVDVPDGDELVSFYSLERDRFMRPAQYEVRHLYFSTEKRGAAAHKDAEEAFNSLGQEPDAHAAPTGDRFNAGSYFSMRLADRIRGALGEEIGAALESAPLNEWIGPLESPYGWHLVRVEDTVPAHAPQLAVISSEVLHTYLRMRGDERLARTLRSLRLRYGVELEEL